MKRSSHQEVPSLEYLTGSFCTSSVPIPEAYWQRGERDLGRYVQFQDLSDVTNTDGVKNLRFASRAKLDELFLCLRLW